MPYCLTALLVKQTAAIAHYGLPLEFGWENNTAKTLCSDTLGVWQLSRRVKVLLVCRGSRLPFLKFVFQAKPLQRQMLSMSSALAPSCNVHHVYVMFHVMFDVCQIFKCNVLCLSNVQMFGGLLFLKFVFQAKPLQRQMSSMSSALTPSFKGDL